MNIHRMMTAVIGAVMTMTLAASADPDVQQAQDLCARLSERLQRHIVFKKIEPCRGADVFTLENNAQGQVVVAGNNANSMAVGLNRYLNRYCHTTVSWYADVPVALPATLPLLPAGERVAARVPQRFFLNYCTYGYTMAFWQWHDWERFIDWMALNGVNMPLAITGQEAVWLRVWTALGMIDDEVRAYFTGPAYLPWHRMANIDGWCGPLPEQWLDGQVKLQQRIVQRERALNMRPVLPAFAGHVPARLRELFPDADIQSLSAWAGFDDRYRTCFLNSEDPLYGRIQRMFLEEQTRLFGTDHIYGVDPFNEVDPPSFDPDYLHDVSRHIYESLTAVDPQAEWLQMAWFLYYQHEYTPERTRAMLTGVPRGKMTMLDYFCEYKEMWRDHEAFYGQPFVWCYLGNFGGNTNVQGRVKEAGLRIEQALKQCGDAMVGIGSTLEGLDVQQFPYEYVLEKAWALPKTDEQVVDELADRHAGIEGAVAARRAWDILYHGVLDITPSNFASPLVCSYPVQGKESRGVKYDATLLLDAWDWMLAQDSVTTDAMTIDVVWVGRQLLGDLFIKEKQAFDRAIDAADTTAMRARSDRMLDLLADLDRLNACHRHATLATWLQQARRLSDNWRLSDYYEMNTRRIITTWGGNLNDYACRNWSGLVGEYYTHLWRDYIDTAMQAVASRRPMDNDQRRRRAADYGEQWAVSKLMPATEPGADVLTLARQLRAKWFKPSSAGNLE